MRQQQADATRDGDAALCAATRELAWRASDEGGGRGGEGNGYEGGWAESEAGQTRSKREARARAQSTEAGNRVAGALPTSSRVGLSSSGRSNHALGSGIQKSGFDKH